MNGGGFRNKFCFRKISDKKMNANSIVCTILCIFQTAAISAYAESIFTIGKPDASAAEFRSFDDFIAPRYYIDPKVNPYAKSHAFFDKPFVYDTAKNNTADWPYVHPIVRCQWADKYAFPPKNPDKYYYVWDTLYSNNKYTPRPYSIKFSLKQKPQSDLYLKIGFVDQSPINANPIIAVEANSKPIGEFALPYDKSKAFSSFSNILYRPKTWGRPAAKALKIPADSLVEGKNVITITPRPAARTNKTQWLAYDYIELADTPELPQVADPLDSERQKAITSFNFDDIVFAMRPSSRDGHWYANFGKYPDVRTGDKNIDGKFATCVYPPNGGRLVKYNVKSGNTTDLINDPKGNVRDPFVHYDADKILFSYRVGGTEQFRLHEISPDGKGLKKLEFYEEGFDDIEPAYLPDGDIAFVSSRCRRMVPCWAVAVAILHRYYAAENVVRPISANVDQDNSPWPTSDGRLLYMKWEYVHRNQLNFHALWKKDTNGGNDMVFFGNDIPKHLLIDAKQIGTSQDYVFTLADWHGTLDHVGQIARLNNPKNPGDAKAIEFISGDNLRNFSHPFPLDDNYILTTNNRRLLVLDRLGHIFELPMPKGFSFAAEGKRPLNIREPWPLRKHPRGRVMADGADYDKTDATVVLINASIGRNMGSVKPDDIAELAVFEVMPDAVHVTGGMEPYTLGGTFSIEKPLGKIKVEKDGSAHFKVPANKALTFVALDKNGNAVKRMQSFTSFAPGTFTSCIGCHENRDMAPPPITKTLAALRRPADKIKPFKGVNGVIDFVRDIQPILTKHCATCHNPQKYAGSLDLSAGMGPMFAKSYFNLRTRRQIVDGMNRNGNMPPYTFGTGSSPLVKKISGSHMEVKLSPEEIQTVKLWLDMGAPNASSCAAADSGMIGQYYKNTLFRPDAQWPEIKAMNKVVAENCAGCHQGKKFLPEFISGSGKDRLPWHWLFYIKKDDPRNRLSHHAIFNTTYPENSAILMAPLAKSAGGRADDESDEGHPVVFNDKNDPRYKTIFAALERARKYANEENPRYSSPNYKPTSTYLSAMKSYGVIKDSDELENFDVFKCDEKYWRTVVAPKAYVYPKTLRKNESD